MTAVPNNEDRRAREFETSRHNPGALRVGFDFF